MTIVYHDYFAIRGGGERVALELAHGLGAELAYGFKTPETYGADAFPPASRALTSGRFQRLPGLADLVLMAGFAADRQRAASHDLRLFSGVSAVFAAPSRQRGGTNIFYCHTPPRALYDQKAFLRGQGGWARRAGIALFAPWMEHGYRRAVNRMDVIVANSENIRRRIRTYLGRDSIVVYPPVDTDRFSWQPAQGYYLSTARLSPLKRVRTIVEAFLAMPSQRLVVASGGTQEAELRALAEGAPNISFTGWIDDGALQRLMAGAISTLYIPIDEDFGISPVESMAAGKPVIGVDEGGLLETILPGRTGLLLPANPSAHDLIAAIGALTPERARAMRSACEAQAGLFSRARFLSEMRAVIAEARAAAR